MYKLNPFGNPDGARADIKEINEMFITSTPYAVDFSVMPEELLNKRVIIGAKGSGKTVYLRKIQALLREKTEEHKTGIYVDDDIEQNLNCTEKVIGFCDYFSENVLSEKWSQLWKISLLITLALKYIKDPQLIEYASDEERNELTATLREQQMLFKKPIATYAIFSALLQHINSRHDANDRISNTAWIDFEETLKGILRKSPVIYVFLDSIDYEYEHAPMHWTMCQKGLFYAVMSMLQDKVWGERYHVIMSMRNNVFAAVLRSEHTTKFCEESHIFCLDWTYSNIKYFIAEKVKKLPDCYFLLENHEDKSVNSWLGIDSIIDHEEESVIDYIARHTRFVPRDVIILCNKLAVMHRLVTNDRSINIVETIREIVKERSRVFGDELLTICAKNINANQIPNGAGRYEYSEGFTASNAYQEGSFHLLKKVMQSNATVKITYNQLMELQRQVDQVFKTESYIADILWQNCAIGYVDKQGIARFHTQLGDVDQLLPKKKDAYIFRTCIIDALGIEDPSTMHEKLM